MGEFRRTEPGTGTTGPDPGAGPAAALREALAAPGEEADQRLLAAVAHQLRTPLTSVSGYLELLGDGLLGPLTGEQRQVLETVGVSVARLADLIDELDPYAGREPADDEPADQG